MWGSSFLEQSVGTQVTLAEALKPSPGSCIDTQYRPNQVKKSL